MAAATACAFFGRSTLDLLYQTPVFPPENSKTMASAFLAQAGGPALNAAVTFAFLGGAAHLISAVGRGGWSQIVTQELQQYGVRLTDFCDLENFSLPVSSVVIHTASGSRTIFNAPAQLSDNIASVPLPTEPLLLADGFYVFEAGTWFHEFAARGGVICLDGGSWRPEMEELLPLAQIAICSESFRPPGARTSEEALDYLAQHGVAAMAITRGGSDIIACEHGRRFAVAIEPVRAIDTLAAGDVLHGAFCWYYLQTGCFEQALRKASKIATRSVEFFGAREWMAHFTARSNLAKDE
jgi:sugar/nucleoside kinase (ribokinase family)